MEDQGWERTKTLTTGMWLAGFGLILLNGRLWPDFLFLLGSVRLVEGCKLPGRPNSRRAGIFLILLATLITCRLGFLEILVLAVAGLVISRHIEHTPTRKPVVDASLL